MTSANDEFSSPDRAFILVLSGPSGAGKSTLITAFRERNPQVVESVSATTRAPRPGEQEGVDYFYLDEPTFVERIEAGGFLEHATVFGRNRYGTPKAPVDAQLARGSSVIMDIDVQGARQIRHNAPDDALLIFIAPPSMAELERRLRGRETEDEEAIQDRLRTAREELAAINEYDYIVVNKDLERAIQDLESVIRAESLRPKK